MAGGEGMREATGAGGTRAEPPSGRQGEGWSHGQHRRRVGRDGRDVRGGDGGDERRQLAEAGPDEAPGVEREEDRQGEGDDEVEEAGRGGGSGSVRGRPVAGVPSRLGGSGGRDVPGCSHHGAEG